MIIIRDFKTIITIHWTHFEDQFTLCNFTHYELNTWLDQVTHAY